MDSYNEYEKSKCSITGIEYTIITTEAMLKMSNKFGYMLNERNQIVDSVGNVLGLIKDEMKDGKKVGEKIHIRTEEWNKVKHSLVEPIDPRLLSQINEILPTLTPLIVKAEKEQLWFYNLSLDVWFSPRELKGQLNKGKYLWGPANWELRNPQERINEMENQIKNLGDSLNDFKSRVEHQ